MTPFPAHSHLAAVCMAHLVESGFQDTNIQSEDEFNAARQADPLLSYSSDAWAFHARQSLDDDEENRQRTSNFIRKASAFPTFIGTGFLSDFDILAPLHILSIYNFPMSLLGSDNIGDPNAGTEIRDVSPLALASWHGHLGAVAFLLADAKTQVNVVDKAGWSVLMLAAAMATKALLHCSLHGPM